MTDGPHPRRRPARRPRSIGPGRVHPAIGGESRRADPDAIMTVMTVDITDVLRHGSAATAVREWPP